ncbi:PREDICTED: major pollen allergen Ole e 1-like [Nicotiana attenuata]|uniref:Anther-specific protein lat52 n=1 Tax=Nicotiana attenuata TaxID=49451 RepID=A0A314KGI5_NICAT|nr:PREDICTED: major pollen allergen Ole e 1-like [Nicotiana attenuata]OIT28501.1 anther-specific protein lat52 [Nicotiana attenuata]
MGKSIVIFICLFYLLGLTQASDEKPDFFVEGRIYCDPCRSLFKNNLMKPIEGAVVFIKCKNPKTNNITLLKLGTTNATGFYRVPVEGDYKNENCRVELTEGNREDCKENPCGEEYFVAGVSLTHNNNDTNGNGNVRKVNDLFFYPKKPSLQECIREFKNMKHIPQVQDVECLSLLDF